mmetsp:Transcript_23918/g.61613  ORF Transcript_23918/g.61613 Transcript_23918/m.61613 type:complete len:222 (-) Transcript_23918:48-713(-)
MAVRVESRDELQPLRSVRRHVLGNLRQVTVGREIDWVDEDCLLRDRVCEEIRVRARLLLEELAEDERRFGRRGECSDCTAYPLLALRRVVRHVAVVCAQELDGCVSVTAMAHSDVGGNDHACAPARLARDERRAWKLVQSLENRAGERDRVILEVRCEWHEHGLDAIGLGHVRLLLGKKEKTLVLLGKRGEVGLVIAGAHHRVVLRVVRGRHGGERKLERK